MIVSWAGIQLAPENQSFETGPFPAPAVSTRKPVAVYVHFPFCASACSYCIFSKTMNTGLIGSYVEAVLDEVDLYARQPFMAGRTISSVHLGGGTPSLVPADKLERIVDRLREKIGFQEGTQVTLEGNPESLSRDDVPTYRRAGIDRISVGVQSLDDRLLREMGRTHSAKTALRTLRDLMDAGFHNLSVDLMYGFASQDADRLMDDVRTIANLGVPHVSVFPLIEGSALKVGRRANRRLARRRREAYDSLVEVLTSSGYDRYGIEDFAANKNSESRYQLDAWEFPKKEVVALGAASLGAAGGCYYSNHPRLEDYFSAVAEGQLPIARHTVLSRKDEMMRVVLLGTKFIHVGKRAFTERYGTDFESALEPLLSLFRRLGVWTVDDYGIHLTHDGMQIISEIWAEILLANLADAAQKRR